jgi:hypothetical protein
MEKTSDLIKVTGASDVVTSGDGSATPTAPADRIRSLVAEAEARGAPMVSAQAMQAKLFTIYDEASVVPEALALVQRHLGLTLDRTWYSEEEIDQLADQLDWLFGLGAVEGEIVPT